MMFSYHRSIGSIYSMELCVKLQDVGGSSSSSNNVEEMRNSGAGEGIPFLDTGRGRSPSFNAFVAPAQNTEIPDQRPFPNVHVAYPEGMADGLADSSEEDEIENDSGEEAELVPETQPVQGERVIPSVVEPVNVARVGALSSGTPDHYLHLSLGPMNSTNVEDIPSNYGLTGEMELEVGMKFVNKDAAMLAVKNYNIRRSGEFKVVESDHKGCKDEGVQILGSSKIPRASHLFGVCDFARSCSTGFKCHMPAHIPYGSSRRNHLHKSVAGICGVGIRIQGVLQKGLASEAKGNSQNLWRLG
ncbi:hypothetical protein Ahy_A08g040046 isoform O [Arachis hypogaea]|uniref:Uncharacterized protein n=1 Tax=Arachis hypogaea TaxID=3818 RepID=A0A445BY49_ARAHY|nr:hypothetical protein Ahy_A08g040046 isoform O [Arachis hypogaea]